VKLNVSKRNQPNQRIDLGKDVLAFDYSETVFLIGRSKDCHVVLDDKQISREHVRIIHKNGKWFAEKTNEENKCLLNGEDLVQKTELENNDTLTISAFTVVVEKDGSADDIEFSAKTDSTPAPAREAVVQTVTKVEAAPVVVSEKNDDSTREIDSSELTSEIPVNEITGAVSKASSGDATADIEVPSDFQSFDSAEKTEDSEFGFEENNESEAEIALGMNSDHAEADSEAVIPAEDGENAYSLENIDSGSDDESTKVMQSFAKIQLDLFGETAPYDKYVIEKDKTFIGRDPAKCQIVLNDSEVSTVHAVITKNNIMITLEDLNSSNGTILNGDRINKATLNHNDEFVIGGVTFTVKFRSDFLKEENQTLMAVDEDQTVEVEEVVEIQAEEGDTFDALGGLVSSEPQEKSILKRIWKDEAQRKKLIYGAVIVIGAWIMLDDGGNNTPSTQKKPKASPKKIEKIITKSGKTLSEDEKRSLSSLYEIGKNHFQNGRYREALDELNKIAAVDPNFNSNIQSLIALSKEGLARLEKLEKEKQEAQAAAEKKAKIKDLIEKARGYVKDRRVELAQETFNDIAKIDPENIEVPRMKMELEDWQKEKARKELEEVSKKKAREDKVDRLKPGKNLFLQKEWFKAIGKLEDFLKVKDMDEDLTKEASEMLKTSREEISAAVAPLQGKAKSLMEGQDLKGAYEVYQQILKVEPSNAEALNMVVEIKEQLANKARKIYREAIISESLSLFQDAKEKFQEVQQISPVDSDYYKKATDKLRDYLE
jgi:pSer/pThr/pTyr-binding forkhead associated (FHA) protein